MCLLLASAAARQHTAANDVNILKKEISMVEEGNKGWYAKQQTVSLSSKTPRFLTLVVVVAIIIVGGAEGTGVGA